MFTCDCTPMQIDTWSRNQFLKGILNVAISLRFVGRRTFTTTKDIEHDPLMEKLVFIRSPIGSEDKVVNSIPSWKSKDTSLSCGPINANGFPTKSGSFSSANQVGSSVKLSSLWDTTSISRVTTVYEFKMPLETKILFWCFPVRVSLPIETETEKVSCGAKWNYDAVKWTQLQSVSSLMSRVFSPSFLNKTGIRSKSVSVAISLKSTTSLSMNRFWFGCCKSKPSLLLNQATAWYKK